jgi:hypothetical protein
MGHDTTARQGVSSENGLREWDDVEAEAHQRNDGVVALRRGRWGVQWLEEQLRALVKLLDLHTRTKKWVRWLGTDGVAENRGEAWRWRLTGGGQEALARTQCNDGVSLYSRASREAHTQLWRGWDWTSGSAQHAVAARGAARQQWLGSCVKGTRGGILSVRRWQGELDRGVKQCGHAVHTGVPAHAA